MNWTAVFLKTFQIEVKSLCTLEQTKQVFIHNFFPERRLFVNKKI